MKHLKFISLISLTIFTFVFAACGGEDDPLPEPSPTPTPVNRQTFTKRWNPDQSMQSRTLNQTVRYHVLVPQEYLNGVPNQTFPVVYLLHGYGESNDSWGPGHFDIQKQDEIARTAGQTGPVIYVMPDGGNSYFVNRFDGSYNYMDMLVNELVPLIDKILPTKANAANRAVAGYSMGGFGALAEAGKNPGVFGTCISLSPSMNTDAQYRTLGAWDSQWGDIFGGRGSIGEARLTSHYRSLCPLHFFADNDATAFTGQTWFIDCGDDEERLYAGSGELHSLLRDKRIPHEYRVRNGAHNSAYWREGLREGLAVFKAASEGGTYVAETPATVSLGATPQSSEISSPCKVQIFKGSGSKNNENTHVIYVELGSGSAASLSAAEIAANLSLSLASKNATLAIVSTADAATTTADAIFQAVESELGLTITDAQRDIIAFGDNTSAIAPLAFSGRSMGSCYFYDSNIAVQSDVTPKGKQYLLHIMDMGKNHREMFNLFCVLRDASVAVDYRVNNGHDTPQSAKYGLANISQIMFNNLPIK